MICVITNEQTGEDKYLELEDNTSITPTKGTTIKCYATLSEALKDSYVWQGRDHYSDGECLDYVMHVIEQMEGVK